MRRILDFDKECPFYHFIGCNGNFSFFTIENTLKEGSWRGGGNPSLADPGPVRIPVQTRADSRLNQRTHSERAAHE